MAIVELTNEQRKRLVNIIAQYANIGSERQRDYFLDDTDLRYKAARASELRIDGSDTDFAKEVISKCQIWGTLDTTRQPALVLVIRYLRNEVVSGHEVAAQFLDMLLTPYEDEPQFYKRTLPAPKLSKPLDSNYLTLPNLEQQRLLDLMQDVKISPPWRARAGRQLAKMGDPRRGVGILPTGVPDIVWCEIPGKDQNRPPNPIGGDKEVFKPLPLTTVDLPTYWISKYPITFAQYQAFSDSDEVDDPRLWKGLGTSYFKSQRFNLTNHPCDSVPWKAAVAYCRWLSIKINMNIRLPMEEEWEKAARGELAFYYAWGDEYESGRANIDEISSIAGLYSVGMTTAVGIYQNGASPYGVMDITGNVWEWTLTSSDINVEYEEQAEKKIFYGHDENSVLRGGSWRDRLRPARAAFRQHFDYTFSENGTVGFRVCTLSTPTYWG